MENNEKLPSFQLLVLITTPKLADKATKIFKRSSLPIQYRFSAEGTASSEIMDMLGLGSIDKCVLVSTVPRRLGRNLLGKLRWELHLGAVNSGIAFTIPITGVNRLILRMLTQAADDEAFNEKGRDRYVMIEAKHVLIAAVVNIGFSGDVMDAAKAAGAGGGTVIHSRWIGNEEIIGSWGVSMQDEKDIVLILSEIEKKVDIMSAISVKCGMQSEAKGIVLSLPIDAVTGF